MGSHVDVFLQELPASAFQAVLQHLHGSDFAAVRLVNRCISARAAAAPYITLRLNASTTRVQLRAWARATRRLQAAPAIHIICCGCISPAVFGAAVELLALRGNVRELHLLGASGSPASAPYAASLASLVPLNRLTPQLKTLVISNLALADLAGDIARLAAVGKQLQVLRVQQVAWAPSGSCTLCSFAGSMQQLPASFTKLQELQLQLPSIAPPLPAAVGVVGPLAGRVSSAAAAAALRQQQAAALVAAAAAVAQLQGLTSLELTRAADIWAVDGSGLIARTDEADEAAAAAAVALAATAMAAASADETGAAAAASAASELPAASCLSSLDAYGSWLLLRMPQLQRLCVETSGANWAVTWDHLQKCGSSSSGGSASDITPMPCIKATYHARMPARPASPSSSSSSSQQGLAGDFAKQLARYSPWPASVPPPNISSLQLAIQGHQLPELQPLLASLPGLHSLKVTLLTTSSQATDLAALVVAAAGAGRLRSLVLLPGMGLAEVTAGTFLPLTAAAGGPGDNLRQLRLVGCFKTAAAAAAGGAASADCAAAAAGWGMLRQLNGLQELCIHQLGPDPLQLPVSCLPASLEALEGRRLHLSSSSRGRNPAAAAAPVLRALHLQHCQLDDAGSLASRELQQLTAAASSWPGMWEAAAGAWPCLRHLIAWCPDTSPMQASSSSSSSGGKGRVKGRSEAGGLDAQAAAAAWAAGPAAEASEQLMLQLARGFAKLQNLHVQHLPCLAASVLRAARQIVQLQHLRLSCAAAAGTYDELLAAAVPAAAASGSAVDGETSSSTSLASGASALKSLVLHVPAGRMPLAGAAAVAPAPAAVAAAAAAAAGPAAAEPAGEEQAACSSDGTWWELQQALLQHMPWSSVSVVADQCLR